MTCVECGGKMEQPEGESPAECQACGRVYVPVDEMGWFNYQVVIYRPDDEPLD